MPFVYDMFTDIHRLQLCHGNHPHTNCLKKSPSACVGRDF